MNFLQRRQFLELMFGSSAALTVSRRWATRLSSLVGAQGTPLDAAAYAASRRFAETASGRIAYVERGSGDAVLFLHGFPLNGFQWRGAIDRLSTVRRCIAPDFLAMGYTEVAEGASVGPAAQAAMIVQLMDALSLAAVDLVANDSGGAVAQLLVAGHPARFRSLLLTNCDTEHDSPPPALLPVIELSKSGKYVDEWLVPWLADKVLARSARGIGGCVTRTQPIRPTRPSGTTSRRSSARRGAR